MVYAQGNLVVSTGDAKLLAYNGRTGKPLWTQTIAEGELSFESGLVTDGSRIYVGAPNGSDVPRIVAFDAADGKPIPGWAKALPAARNLGGEVFGISGSKVLGGMGAGSTFAHLVARQSDGAPVSLPKLPGKVAELFFGTGRTIVGRLRFNTVLIYSVYADPSGKRIGTVRLTYGVLAQRDERHLLASEELPDGVHVRILELVRPR